jgi:hypothetical protein
MSEPAERLATYQDIVDLPETLVGEILHGALYTHPRPAPRHARAYSALGWLLGGPFDWGQGGPGGWWILDEPELHLGSHRGSDRGPQGGAQRRRDVLVPDLAGWRRERLPALPETAWFELAPDWVCEILSPGTAPVDRAVKMPIYAREGVPHLWLVDPDARTLEVYRLEESGHWLLLATLKDDEPVRQRPFDALELPLGTLWA